MDSITAGSAGASPIDSRIGLGGEERLRLLTALSISAEVGVEGDVIGDEVVVL